ncbi:hypothetical protein FE257_007367 [Aspergillus nanangensis]|uniref:DUF7729 domain-containing protein n=1 Tax=Aspergillus nanangensis TaxID=2582783 RepID=A0AAD4GUA8_ASPNN|nr:hypothetical protein FE257_007367 [Aspergillus nanangensis]
MSLRPRRHKSPWPLVSLLFLLAGTVVPSHAASMVIARSDLSSAPSGEIVGDDPIINVEPPRASTPPSERAPPPLYDITSNHDDDYDDEEQPDFLTRRTTDPNTLPTAFDTSVSRNFTADSCPEFIDKFLKDSTFTNCHAISFLLRNSKAFFSTLHSAPATSHLLDLACAVDAPKCIKKMADFAAALPKDSACGADYRAGNPIVRDAYTDFITYEPIYRATCLKNPATNDYCFVDAVTNATNPADYDVYSVPYGSSLSSAPYPSCNQCLQATMGIFSQWASVDGQPLVHSYVASAKGVNSKCGDAFTNANVTVGVEKEVSAASWAHTTPDMFLSGGLVALTLGMTMFGLF